MKYSIGLIAAGLLSVAGTAYGDAVTATATVVSDYDFRGITLTSKEPALQISVDYAHDSGFYAGIWGSRLNFGDCCHEKAELDYYTGYAWNTGEDLAWNAYFIYYTYPSAQLGGVSFDYPETNIGLTYKWLGAKLWYSWDYNNTDKEGYYVDLSGTFPMPQDFNLVVHGGYSGGDYWSSINSEYFDYSIGVTKSVGHFNLALKFIDGSDALDGDDTDPGNTYDHDVFSTDSKVFFSVSTTFPWSSK
jgi:uncharacterized protein (TIGR02001 family)